MSGMPAAVRASLVLLDRTGNRGNAAVADFARGQAGGLTLSAVSFTGSKTYDKASGEVSDLGRGQRAGSRAAAKIRRMPRARSLP